MLKTISLLALTNVWGVQWVESWLEIYRFWIRLMRSSHVNQAYAYQAFYQHAIQPRMNRDGMLQRLHSGCRGGNLSQVIVFAVPLVILTSERSISVGVHCTPCFTQVVWNANFLAKIKACHLTSSQCIPHKTAWLKTQVLGVFSVFLKKEKLRTV